jgi:hypothetical protein
MTAGGMKFNAKAQRRGDAKKGRNFWPQKGTKGRKKGRGSFPSTFLIRLILASQPFLIFY